MHMKSGGGPHYICVCVCACVSRARKWTKLGYSCGRCKIYIATRFCGRSTPGAELNLSVKPRCVCVALTTVLFTYD